MDQTIQPMKYVIDFWGPDSSHSDPQTNSYCSQTESIPDCSASEPTLYSHCLYKSRRTAVHRWPQRREIWLNINQNVSYVWDYNTINTEYGNHISSPYVSDNSDRVERMW